MAYLSKHTWYTTFRRQSVLFWLGLVFPSIFIRRSQGEFPGEEHRSNAPRAVPRCLVLYEVGWTMDDRGARGLWGWRQISIRFCLAAGTSFKWKGPDLWGRWVGICLVGSWSGPGLDQGSTLENLPRGRQEWSKCIRQEGFGSNSYAVVDTKFHLALPSLRPPTVRNMNIRGSILGPHCLYVLRSAACWNLPAPSDDPAPGRQGLNSAPLNANSVGSCQWAPG